MRHIDSPVASLQPPLRALLASYGHQSPHMKLPAQKSLRCLTPTRRITPPKSILRTVNIIVDISNPREPAVPLVTIRSDLLRRLRNASSATRKDVGQRSILRRNVISQERDSRTVLINTSRSTKETRMLTVK